MKVDIRQAMLRMLIKDDLNLLNEYQLKSLYNFIKKLLNKDKGVKK